jgi:hypothetical protein
LADIDASPRALLDTTFSISRDPQNRRVSTSEVISNVAGLATHCPGFPGQKWPSPRRFG